MGRVEGEIEQKGLPGGRLLADVAGRPRRQQGQHLDRLEPPRDPIALEEPAHVAGVGEADERVEAAGERAVGRRAADLIAVDLEAEVPLADAGGRIPSAAEQGGQGEPVGGDQRRAGGLLEHALPSRVRQA